jgi:hypothetical protein
MSVALLIAALGNDGLRPAPRLAQAYQHPQKGWTLFPPLGEAAELLPAEEARSITGSLKNSGLPTWSLILSPEGENITWYLGGTISNWDGLPLALVVVIETDNPSAAEEIGEAMLAEAIAP